MMQMHLLPEQRDDLFVLLKYALNDSVNTEETDEFFEFLEEQLNFAIQHDRNVSITIE